MTSDPKKTGTANQYHPKIEEGNHDAVATWIAQNNLPSKEASLLVYAGITAMDQFKLFCPRSTIGRLVAR